MDVKLYLQGKVLNKHIAITGSKSETNRLLLLNALYPGISISNISESDDSAVMQQALQQGNGLIDVHHAGTAMRFLTAYFAIQPGSEVIITGSQRMRERPIGILVDALIAIGADIEYTDNAGYPPLKIKGKELSGGSVTINANVSSQYITALLLIGSKLHNGLKLYLQGEITSLPYILMTLGLLQEIGIDVIFRDNCITVAPQAEILDLKSEIFVESDWSSASYFYSIIALSQPGTQITLSSYRQNSLQGDSALAEIYRQLGVETEFTGSTITLTKRDCQPLTVNLQLNNTPDIAQTIAVTCFGLGIGCKLTGLHTLKIKETDRLEALQNEMQKLGAEINITNDSLDLQPARGINPDVAIETYNDHRMAMAFAPLALKVPIVIKDAGVVSKSYPSYWNDLKQLGFIFQEA